MFGLGFVVPAPAVADAPVPPPPAESDHYCPTPGCDASWWGPAPCWMCGAEGVARAGLPEPALRQLWMWTNQFRPSTEGEPPA